MIPLQQSRNRSEQLAPIIVLNKLISSHDQQHIYYFYRLEPFIIHPHIPTIR